MAPKFIKKLVLPSKNEATSSVEKVLNVPDLDAIQYEQSGQVYKFNANKFDRDFVEQKNLNPDAQNADVRIYHHRPAGRDLVIKYVAIQYSVTDREQSPQLKQLIREIKIHRESAVSPNITAFYGVCIHEMQALICMEVMTTSLAKFYPKVHNKEGYFPEHLLGNISVSILDGLDWCKSRGIIHRDIKPHNILLNKEGYVKLCDFGLARELDHSFASTYCGTFIYMAPERIQNPRQKYGFKADIWSFGMTIAEVAAGKFPIEVNGGDQIAILRKISDLKLDKVCEIIDNNFGMYSDMVKDFSRFCLQELEYRPDIKDLLETEFFKHYKKVHKMEDIQEYMIGFD